MKEFEQQTSHPNWLNRFDSIRTFLRAAANRLATRAKTPEPSENVSVPPKQTTPALKIAGYSLVLMDPDGQVVWTREWDSGGVFEFRPRQRLRVFCGFTNHSEREAEISEYEIELMGEDGMVVERFGESFGDSVIIPPGQSKHFPAEWRM
jgi:hypothetical protein